MSLLTMMRRAVVLGCTEHSIYKDILALPDDGPLPKYIKLCEELLLVYKAQLDLLSKVYDEESPEPGDTEIISERLDNLDACIRHLEVLKEEQRRQESLARIKALCELF